MAALFLVMTARIPKNGEIQENKVWFERTGDMLTLGVTLAAMAELGEIESIELGGSEGHKLDADELLVTLDGSLGHIEVVAPVECSIVSTNSAVEDDPSIVAEDPLEAGWLVKIEVADLDDFLEATQPDS